MNKKSYYDARYPGESYIEVTEEDVDRAIQVTQKVVRVIQQLHDRSDC